MQIFESYQVVISSYNSAFYLERCLRSVDKIFKNKKWILLFVDDSSVDHTQHELNKILPSLSVIFIHLKYCLKLGLLATQKTGF